jgi:hypothetical protein
MEAEYLLRARPPLTTGLSIKSPTTAPSGLVNTKALQKTIDPSTFLDRCAKNTPISRIPKITALPMYPSLALSAVQSPSAVP